MSLLAPREIRVIEANACGVPVVAARAGSVPEVVRDAALLVDPGSPAALAEALRRVLDDVVAPNAALYVSGHDHNTQVARVDDGTLAIVVGAGGKTTAAGTDHETVQSPQQVEPTPTQDAAAAAPSSTDGTESQTPSAPTPPADEGQSTSDVPENASSQTPEPTPS